MDGRSLLIICMRFTPCRPMQPVFHSSFNGLQGQEVCGCPLLPLKTAARGPNPLLDPQGKLTCTFAAKPSYGCQCDLIHPLQPCRSA